MEWLTDPAAWLGLLTLVALEIVLGIDNLIFLAILAEKLPPDIVHWQHFHGFKDDSDATCPTEAADLNHDGIIDLIETEPASGATMVPFDEDPVAMDIGGGTYPKAGTDGTFQYQKTVSLKALDAAFAKAFGDKELDLDRRLLARHTIKKGTGADAIRYAAHVHFKRARLDEYERAFRDLGIHLQCTAGVQRNELAGETFERERRRIANGGDAATFALRSRQALAIKHG